MLREQQRRTVNRVLIILAVAALLGGLLLAQWDTVRFNALLLCFSCMGLG